eukprot:TRINITY_DN3340_c0_g1_i2.p2 TRINITY_DN3340_c0_g1~~TRINITY_DN3340_c0_g1_i2.p2  ORF type:complete len:203 (-),score=61.13 TRINITY_DN3340_c0_g1_i2:79-687(-)
MLHSMLLSNTPTAAEVSDVTNAVYDGTDCLSLSAETAKGKNPLVVLDTAAQICHEAESNIDYPALLTHIRTQRAQNVGPVYNKFAEALAASAVTLAQDTHAGVIVCVSSTGYTGHMIAKYRPHCPVVLVTSHPQTARQSIPVRGVFPVVVPLAATFESVVLTACAIATKHKLCLPGSVCVVTVGKSGRKPAAPYSLQLRVVP